MTACYQHTCSNSVAAALFCRTCLFRMQWHLQRNKFILAAALQHLPVTFLHQAATSSLYGFQTLCMLLPITNCAIFLPPADNLCHLEQHYALRIRLRPKTKQQSKRQDSLATTIQGRRKAPWHGA